MIRKLTADNHDLHTDLSELQLQTNDVKLEDEVHQMIISNGLKEHLTSLSFRYWYHCAIRFSAVWSKLWLWPPTTKHVDHHNAIGKLIDTRIIFGVGYHHLWWHVCWGTRSLGHATDLKRGKVEDPGHTQIRDLGCHVGREEDIVGREISVNDSRNLAMEVAQAQRHIMKDRVADLLWKKPPILLNAGGEVGGEKLHD